MSIRTAVQIFREMALIKAQCKDDPQTRDVLLKPLQAELGALVELQKKQLQLDLSDKKK